jgi:hypothetical protein
MVGLMKRIAKLQHDMPRNEDLLAIRAALERLLVTRLSPFDIERHGLPRGYPDSVSCPNLKTSVSGRSGRR